MVDPTPREYDSLAAMRRQVGGQGARLRRVRDPGRHHGVVGSAHSGGRGREPTGTPRGRRRYRTAHDRSAVVGTRPLASGKHCRREAARQRHRGSEATEIPPARRRDAAALGTGDRNGPPVNHRPGRRAVEGLPDWDRCAVMGVVNVAPDARCVQSLVDHVLALGRPGRRTGSAQGESRLAAVPGGARGGDGRDGEHPGEPAGGRGRTDVRTGAEPERTWARPGPGLRLSPGDQLAKSSPK